jgi:trehalose 6-phosphate synthase
LNRLVVVSNRLDLPPGDQAPGGLAVSLAAVLRAIGGLWFGWSGAVVNGAQGLQRRTMGNIDYAIVDLTPEEYRDYYHGFSNSVLWPLCHGLPSATGPNATSYLAYQKTNERYARLLLPLLEPHDLLWVNDFHLLPLGTYLRAVGCRHRIGFFLHVPFPPLQQQTEGSELLRALLAYDLIGFQTTEDLLAFQTAARWQWGASAVAEDDSLHAEGRRVATGVFPVGIDVDAVSAAALRMTPAEAAVWWPGGRDVPRLIGADRLDATKGLPLRLQAYRHFLAAQPSDAILPDYLQLITPSRNDLPAHQALRESIQAETLAINKQYAGEEKRPLRCAFTAVDHTTLMGLLATADVGLVTPLKDGMNLLAKEFVAAQPTAHPGVLVLSAYAGAARELEAALLVDPHDVHKVARAVTIAVNMPLDERQQRQLALLAALKRNERSAWQERFLGRLLDSTDY